MGQSIADTKIAEGNWRRKHVETIRQIYRHRPYFEMYFPLLSFIIQEANDLCGLNIRLMAQIMAWLDLKNHVVDSRQYPIDGAQDGHADFDVQGNGGEGISIQRGGAGIC